MPTFHFPLAARCRNVAGLGLQPVLDTTLFFGASKAGAPGLIDSGASATVFSRDVAEALGIEDLFSGQRATGRTLAGTFDYYLFDLEIEIRFPKFAKRFPAQVGFFSVATSRNILGRSLLFAYFMVAVRERTQEIYLSPEEYG